MGVRMWRDMNVTNSRSVQVVFSQCILVMHAIVLAGFQLWLGQLPLLAVVRILQILNTVDQVQVQSWQS